MSLTTALERLDPRRWSLTTRLTLFFSVMVAAILFTVSALLYGHLGDQLRQKDETELAYALKVQQGIVRALESESGPDLWQREWLEHIGRGDRLALRVLSPSGAIYSQSAQMVVEPGAFPKPDSPLKFKRWKKSTDDGPVRFLLTSSLVRLKSRQEWVVQGAFDLTQSHQILEAYWSRLAWLLLLATAVSSCLGWLLVRRGLAPVREMSSAIGRINAEKLHERIGNRAWPAELRTLADTFDGMLERLEAAFQQLSRFSSDLAHEFRSPISNLVAAASVMLSRERSASEYQETLAVMVEEGERLSRMVSGMLFLARADNAKQAIHLEAVSTAGEYARVVDVFEAVAEEHRVRMSHSGDFTVQADPLLLRRALSNLVTNAMRHTPPGGEIRLTATAEAEGVALTVADTGSGIAPEHLPHIFERFYRADAARSSSESTGLGLAVVKSIAELHGGTVRVQSTLGKGTAVTLVLPKAA